MRDGIWGEQLLAFSAIERMFSHPGIISIISAILDEPQPFLQKMKTNRYTPFHPGVGRHTDGKPGELSPPFSIVSTQVFLDDIEIDFMFLDHTSCPVNQPIIPTIAPYKREDRSKKLRCSGTDSRERDFPAT